jgi:hypothetical protein
MIEVTYVKANSIHVLCILSESSNTVLLTSGLEACRTLSIQMGIYPTLRTCGAGLPVLLHGHVPM